jgi:tetratricopeptide (TPR) repeat protein
MTFSILRRTSAAFLAAAAAAFISGGNASAQAPRPTSPAGAAPAAAPATNAGAAAAPGGGTATPGAPGTAEKPQDTLTVEALIGDAVSLSNQQYPEVESAIQRFRNSDPAGARDYLTMAKQKYPKLPPVDLLMAKMWVFFRNGEQARQQLEETVKNNPNDPEAYLLLADLAFAEGRTTEAHALFEKARGFVDKFTENPKRQQNFQIRVLAGLAAVHERREQWAEANALLTKWVQIDPDSDAAHTRLGVTLYHLGKPDQALAEFKKARDLKTTAPHPQVVLGSLYAQDKKPAEAQKAFEAAYKEDGKNESTARAYAQWLIQQDQLDKAQQVAATMRKNQPNSVAALMLDGVIAKMRNQSEAAEEAFTKVLTLDVTNADATNLLALVLADSTNPAQQEKALSYAKMNAQRFPNSPQANVAYAWILTKLNRGNEAGEYLQRVLQQRNALTADSAYLIARIFMQNNQKDQAKLALEQVLQQAGNGMFMFRKDAEKLLKELGGTVPQTSKTATTAPGAATAPAGGRATAGGTVPAPGAAAPGAAAPQTPPVAGQ